MSARKPLRNGRRASPLSAPPSGHEALPNKADLERLLAAIYNEYQKLPDRAANKRCRWDLVFHMTDWARDLQRLAELYRNPEQVNRAAAEDIVTAFLLHVIPHLMEAGRLLLDYEPGYIFDSPKPKKTRPSLKPARPRRPRLPSP
jgi:hypothetical protein